MKAASITVTDSDRATLQRWAGAHSGEQRLALRARIILSVAQGLSNEETAQSHGTRAATVSMWRGRFAERGLKGLLDAPRSGKPASYDARTERRILAALDEEPPEGCARWNGPLLAERLTSPSTTSGVSCADTTTHWSAAGTCDTGEAPS